MTEGAKRDALESIYRASKELADRKRKSPETRDEELEYLEKAYEAATLLGKTSRRATLAMHLANLLLLKGDVVRVTEILQKARGLIPADDVRQYWIGLILIQALSYRNLWDEALAAVEFTEKSLATGPENDRKRVTLEGRRGQVYLRMGILDQAASWTIGAWTKADAHRDDADWLTTRAQLSVFRADLRAATENYSLLEQEIEETLLNDDYRTRPSARSSLLLRSGIALVHLERDATDREPRAAKVLEEVSLDPATLATERREAIAWLSYIDYHAGDYDSSRNRIDQLEKEESLAGGAHDSPDRKAFIAALSIRLDLRTNQDKEQIDSSRRKLVEAYEQILSDWRSNRPRAGGFGFLQFAKTRAILSELIRVTVEVDQDPDQALLYLIQAQELGTLARSLPTEQTNVAKVKERLLGPSEGMLVFLPATDESHVFSITREKTHHDYLPTRDILMRKKEHFLSLLLRPPQPDEDVKGRRARIQGILPTSKEVGSLLLPPELQQRISQWSEITIVGLDVLGYLPFECLLLEDDTFLGLTKPLSYLPSLPVGLALLQRRQQRGFTQGLEDALEFFFLLGPKHGERARKIHNDVMSLKVSEIDRQRLFRPFKRYDQYSEEAATFDTLLEESARSAQAWLILAHGIHDYSREQSGGLILAATETDDGLVFADRLESLNPPPLAVLLACAAGRGPGRSGDPGASDLGGSLLSRGTDTVVLPVSHLAYRPTVELAVTFLDQVAGGVTPAKALLAARKELTKGEVIPDPFAFGLLHVRGLGHFPALVKKEKNADRPWVLWGAGAGILVLVLGAYGLGRRQSESKSG